MRILCSFIAYSLTNKAAGAQCLVERNNLPLLCYFPTLRFAPKKYTNFECHAIVLLTPAQILFQEHGELIKPLSESPEKPRNEPPPEESKWALSDLSGWWARQDLNLGPTDYESAALTS